MKEIQLTKGYVALVDDEDYAELSKYKWYIADYKRGHKYARRWSATENGKRHVIFMHQVILNPEKGLFVDHIDGNGLNNQRNNLRVCTRTQNNQNARKLAKGTSQYKGVAWKKANGKWQAYIAVNKKQIHLGYFNDELSAARAYDAAAEKYFGEFARSNGSS